VTYFETITLFGYGAAGVSFFFLFYLFSTREKAFYILIVHTSESLFNQLVKQLYRSPRPYFFQDTGMKIFGSCAATYGNPSGHASFSAAFYVTLFLVTFHDRDYRPDDRPVMRASINQRSLSIVNEKSMMRSKWAKLKENRVFYIAGIILTAFMVLGIGSSRFMLGAHSID
jgi:membrane-associated phospholipid phosphatase